MTTTRDAGASPPATSTGCAASPDWRFPRWTQGSIRHGTCSSCATQHATAWPPSWRRGASSTLVHYPVPPHRQNAYRTDRLAALDLPVAESMAREVLSLPMDPTLGDRDVGAVVAAVRDACAALPPQVR